jgi:hypothetical protein
MKTSDDRQKAEKIWDRAEKQYESWREDKGKNKWQSNHVVPITFSVVLLKINLKLHDYSCKF